ncbi:MULTISPECIES: RNA polymerase subunit sigma-70 [unclassified Bacillus cereus group]|uniref:RNA polymerase subunit sigma-70 n=1 Tax=unclassified Bacillus cereus group TaxID=2750818 RepID=UPI001F568682|nr:MULTISPECIES: RNA polymerase subunit sigma-70 [unclassified Bacillus cereus group]
MCTKVMPLFKNPIDMDYSNKNFLIENYAELKRYCMFLTKNKWDGEDLAQEAVCKVLQKYAEKDICMTLLYKIARNQWFDQLKSKSVQEKVEKEVTFETPHEIIADLHEMAEKVVTSLNAQQTVIFLLKDVFQYHLSDIAKICSISEGAVKASLFRSRNKLKMRNEEDSNLAWQDDVKVVVTAVREQKPELLTKLLPTIHFTHVSSKEPVLLFSAKKSSSYNFMLCAA